MDNATLQVKKQNIGVIGTTRASKFFQLPAYSPDLNPSRTDVGMG